MVADSFRGEIFGPAQRQYGATFVVDCRFRRDVLDADGLVVDIGRASMVLRELLAEIDCRNLDEELAVAGQNTTTEFLARVIFDRMAGRIAAGELGAGAQGLSGLRVMLSGSHVAWAAYEGRLGAPLGDGPAPGTP